MCRAQLLSSCDVTWKWSSSNTKLISSNNVHRLLIWYHYFCFYSPQCNIHSTKHVIVRINRFFGKESIMTKNMCIPKPIYESVTIINNDHTHLLKHAWCCLIIMVLIYNIMKIKQYFYLESKCSIKHNEMYGLPTFFFWNMSLRNHIFDHQNECE